MQAGLYQSAAAMDALSKNLDVVAYNLANISTTGFKRRIVAHEGFTKALAAGHARLTIPRHRDSIDFSQGVLANTGNPLDLAIAGPGFFRVDTNQGPRYMRSGTFVPTTDGGLVNLAGDRLAMRGRLSNLDGAITIDGEGQISQNGADTGARIPMVQFDDLTQLRPDRSGTFIGNPGLEKPGTGVLKSGTLEQSNSSSVDALIGLVTLTRAFESSSRALRTVDESIQRTTTAP
jgi:flagellar basal body rod protein FlgG